MNNLEFPGTNGRVDPDELYLYRGANEVSAFRPYLTGDVFDGLNLPGSTGKSKKRKVAVLHHPCSMRKNGVDLNWSILVAEVKTHRPLDVNEWTTGHFSSMPLPELDANGHRDYAINFDNLYTVSPKQLECANRIASLSAVGVNLLLQRWVHYMSRVVVPTFIYNEATTPFYEESELIEEWCEQTAVDASPDAIRTAGLACMTWLRAEQPGGRTYQEMLKNPQSRSTVRKALRTELRKHVRASNTAEQKTLSM